MQDEFGPGNGLAPTDISLQVRLHHLQHVGGNALALDHLLKLGLALRAADRRAHRMTSRRQFENAMPCNEAAASGNQHFAHGSCSFRNRYDVDEPFR